MAQTGIGSGASPYIEDTKILTTLTRIDVDMALRFTELPSLLRDLIRIALTEAVIKGQEDTI
jgi:hypothetical protein